MKDFSWMKALVTGKLVERFFVLGKPCALYVRGDGYIASAHPDVYSLFLFHEKKDYPRLSVILEETLLGDFCLYVSKPDGKTTGKSIIAHFPFMPDYPSFKSKAISITEQFLTQKNTIFRIPRPDESFFDADMR